MSRNKVTPENRRGMAPAMFALVAALAALVFGGLYLLFGAWPSVNQLTAYDIGARAFDSGVPRNANPYMAGPDRTDWFRGWDWAKKLAAIPQKAGAK